MAAEGIWQIPLDDRFLARLPDASLKPDQVLISVFVPLSGKWEFVSAFRQAPRQQNALATVNSGMRVVFKEDTSTITDFRILYGGLGATTVSANKTCQQLIGRCWDEEMLTEACRMVLEEISLPVSAPGGMVEYRRTLTISFLFKFYLDVLKQLKMRGIDPQQPPQDPVGRPIMHQSGIKHATGEAVFCDDMSVLAEELFLAVVTSSRPHARIISIDASEALASPGVVDVITAQDVPGDNGREEESLYAQDEVICVGQIICAVAADSYAHAKQATKKVKVVYQDVEPLIVTVQEMVARTLGIPKNRINCHVKRVGGAFGGKASKPGFLAAVAAVAARKTGYPIRFILERGDDMLITGGRHPLLGKYKIGFMNDGKIKAADIQFYINGGCTPDDSELVIEYALLKLENAYKIPNLRVQGRVCKTNLPSNTAFRGFGFPQGAFVTETWVSAVAAKCHLPPEKVASRELKIPMSYIHLDEMNTVTVPNTIATGGSTGADVNGRAVQNACQILMKRLEPVVSQNPNGTWEEWVNEAFTQSISLSATGYFRGYKADMDWEKGEGDIYPYFVFGAACSEVEIDCLTGAHKIEGAFVQGLGLYTLEELKYSPEGVLYTRGPNQYKIPSVTDIPEEFHVSLLAPTQNPKAIYSSKGLGEAGIFLGSSVFFAIADAVAAARKERGLPPIWAMNSPVTAELIRMACEDQFTDLERLAKCHGTQCGFCSPGMVMSIYTLLRNHPEPTPDQITEALGGNLCRCTGYRPIVESGKTFSPRMAEDPNKRRLTFQGARTIWFMPVTLEDLLELKASYPKAPLVMGNTAVGPSIKFKGEFHPVFISPLGLPELHFVNVTNNGATIGAGNSLEQFKDALNFLVSEQPKERTKTYYALLKHLRTLAGPPIRNMATIGGHVASQPNFSDLTPILAAGNATINVISKEGERQLPLNGPFFERSLEEASLKPEEVVLSISIPYSTQWQLVAGFRLAQRQENSFAIVNAGMSVEFEEGTNTIKDLRMFFGSVAPTVVSAKQTCKQLLGRQWDDQMLSDSCRWVLEEIRIPPAAKGGMVEFRRTLIISLLFKFYLKVRRWLNEMCVDPSQPQQDPVGHPVMHQSAIKHATGEAKYVDDRPPMDQELALVVVTSTRAHAKITSLDVSEALECPGVVDVITAEDVPGDNNHSGEIFFAQSEVICVGQIVCAVAADTYAHAKEAAKHVKIAYDDIEPAIITIEQALEHDSFLSPEKKIEQGNVECAFKHVDQVIEGEVHVEGQEHFYLETQTILAIPQTEDKEMVLHLGTQFPTHVQEYVSAALKVPRNRIACRMKRAGGAFGGKVTKPALLGAVAAVAANKTGRPIRFILDRGNDMLITAGRHPLLGKYKIGFMNNGEIKAADVEYYINGGCTPDESELVIEFIVLKSENAYYIPNFRCRGRACKTNLPSNTAFRGFGFPQATVVVEAYITAVASKCNLLPEEAAALVHIYIDGSVLLSHGGCELGQGLHTKMIQVASRELNIPQSYVHLSETSTVSVPNAVFTAGSMGTDINGKAVQNACQILLDRLQPIIKKNPEGKWKEWVAKAFEESINLSATGYFKGYQTNMDWEKEEGDAYPYYVYGAACSEVEVDCLTGAHKLLRTDIFMDAAFSINPALDIGQVEGAFIQGMGFYTIEELKYSPKGVLYSRGPDDYKIPTVTEIPKEFYVTLVHSRNPIAIYSSKVPPSKTVMIVRLTGTKYACGTGGCGACTVMVSKHDPVSKKTRHFSVMACLVPLCSLHGTAVTTVEGVGSIKTRLHPVQERIAKSHGTQCGFCTPGMVMSMYTLLRNHPQPSEEQLMEALGGPAMRSQGHFYPVLLSLAAVPDLRMVTKSSDGLTIGACCSLAQVKDILAESISELPEEKTQTYRALLKHLRSLAGQQIRNMASLGGHVLSRHRYSDLNPILSVGNAILNLLSEEGMRQIALDGHFLAGLASADLKPGEILGSVYIPHSQKWEFVSAFRQAQCHQNALPDVNAGMRVLFREGTDIIEDLSIAYGGVGPTTISAHRSCQQLVGRHWNALMLDEACRRLLDEVSLPGSALGGKVEYKRTLMVSFLFKFYLEVLQELKRKVKLSSESTRVDPHQPLQDPVGRPIMHLSGLKHATGEAIFCDDIPRVDKELFMALVTSTRAHAKIISIDSSEVFTLPGVVDVITAEDIPGTNGDDDDKLLAVDEVHCVGQVICAVVAETDVQAKRATEKIKITYEDLKPVIFTIKDAIKHNSFLCPEKKLEQGNIEEAFENVDQVVEGEVHVGGQEHFYMETQRVLVIPKTEDKELDMYVSTQDPAHVQKTVSSTLNIPSNKITCHVKRVGGGFGGKVGRPAVFGAIAAVGAVKTGHPVRLVLDREDDMLITGGRHPLFGKYKVGFMNSGRIKALDIECYINGGCTLDDSELVTEFLILKLENAYKIRNLRFRGRACMTNLPSNTAFRGFGFPQGTLVTESCITAVAAKCGLPPEKIREKNMYKTVDKTIYKQAFSPEPLIRCWTECLDKSSFHIRRTQVEEFNRKNYWKKRGIAIIPMKFSVGFAATSYHQVASRELKVPMSHMHICETSTATVPNTIATAASIGADVNGRAVQVTVAVSFPDELYYVSSFLIGTRTQWLASGKGYKAFMDWEKQDGEPFPYYVYGAACSEVEIDCLTGAHKIEGAFIQGMGLYTTEELHYSPEGVLYSRSPDEYKIPTVTDVPEQFNVSLLPSSQTPLTIYSSKGLGESGMFLGSSVFFAIADAVAAARRERDVAEDFTVQSPATPERVRMACADRFTDMVGCHSVPTSSALLPAPLDSSTNHDLTCV
ncbi:xanthine dehydrogenase [Cricetulus griseus]